MKTGPASEKIIHIYKRIGRFFRGAEKHTRLMRARPGGSHKTNDRPYIEGKENYNEDTKILRLSIAMKEPEFT